MSFPRDVGIIDTMISFPIRDPKAAYDFIHRQTKDEESKEFEFPVEYMFKDVPHPDLTNDPVAVTLAEMDRHGIDKALVAVAPGSAGRRAVGEHPDRFLASLSVDPNDGMAFVGDEATRYYKGPRIMLVKTRTSDAPARRAK